MIVHLRSHLELQASVGYFGEEAMTIIAWIIATAVALGSYLWVLLE